MPPTRRDAAYGAVLGEAPTKAPDVVGATAKPAKRHAKVMMYMHPKVASKLKEIAFLEDKKVNDVILEVLDLYFTKTGHTSLKYLIESWVVTSPALDSGTSELGLDHLAQAGRRPSA